MICVPKKIDSPKDEASILAPGGQNIMGKGGVDLHLVRTGLPNKGVVCSCSRFTQ